MTELGRVPVLLRETSVWARIGGGGPTLLSRPAVTAVPAAAYFVTALVAMGRRTRAVRGRRHVS